MSQKRAATGFKGIALAPVTENTLTSYKTSAGESPALRGQHEPHLQGEHYRPVLRRRPVRPDQERHAARTWSCTWRRCRWNAWLRWAWATYDEETRHAGGATSTPPGKEYALRFVVDTVSGLPFYFNYRAVPADGHPVRQLHHQAGQRDRVRGHHHRRVQAAQHWRALRRGP